MPSDWRFRVIRKPDLIFCPQNFTIVGKWNATECSEVTTQVLDVADCKEKKYGYCFDDLEIALPMNIEYIAFSGFFFTTDEAGVKPVNGTDKLRNAAKTFCNEPYAKWLSKYYRNDSTHAEYGCFKINLVKQMLIDKYQFTEEGYRRMQILRKVSAPVPNRFGRGSHVRAAWDINDHLGADLVCFLSDQQSRNFVAYGSHAECHKRSP